MEQNQYTIKLAKLKQLSVAIANGNNPKMFETEAKIRGLNLNDILILNDNLVLDDWDGQGEAEAISKKIIDYYNAHNNGLNPNALEELRNQDKKKINNIYTNGKTLEIKAYKPIQQEQKVFRLKSPQRGIFGWIRDAAYSFSGLFG